MKRLYNNSKHLFNKVSKFQRIIDRFYPPFKRFLPIDSFRYIFCGGSNTVLDIFLYFVLYNFVIQKKVVHFLFISISPHILAFIIVFPITLVTGFLLSKYITFSESQLQGRIQFFRFGLTILSSLVLQYFLLKLLIDFFHVYPTPSKIITSAIVAISTFFSHRFFSFEVKS